MSPSSTVCLSALCKVVWMLHAPSAEAGVQLLLVEAPQVRGSEVLELDATEERGGDIVVNHPSVALVGNLLHAALHGVFQPHPKIFPKREASGIRDHPTVPISHGLGKLLGHLGARLAIPSRHTRGGLYSRAYASYADSQLSKTVPIPNLFLSHTQGLMTIVAAVILEHPLWTSSLTVKILPRETTHPLRRWSQDGLNRVESRSSKNGSPAYSRRRTRFQAILARRYSVPATTTTTTSTGSFPDSTTRATCTLGRPPRNAATGYASLGPYCTRRRRYMSSQDSKHGSRFPRSPESRHHLATRWPSSPGLRFFRSLPSSSPSLANG